MGLFTEWNNWCEQKRGCFGTMEGDWGEGGQGGGDGDGDGMEDGMGDGRVAKGKRNKGNKGERGKKRGSLTTR
jgi:hypothetical protein